MVIAAYAVVPTGQGWARERKPAAEKGAKAGSPTDPDTRAAKELFQRAQARFVKKDYDLAATGFMAAYERKPMPAFLFNAAVAYEKAGQLDHARELFDKYLALDVNAPDAPEVRARIAAIDAKLKPPAPPAPTPPPTATPTPPSTPPVVSPPPAVVTPPAVTPAPATPLAPQVIWQDPTPPPAPPPPAATTTAPATSPDATAAVPPAPAPGAVTVDSRPRGASIHIGDRSQPPVGVTPWQGMLDPVPTKIVVEAPGYQPDERTVTPTADKVTDLYFSLSEQHFVAWLDIACNVPGTPVYLDSKTPGPIGRTPYSGNVKPGRHTVILEAPGYKPATRDIDVGGGAATQVMLTLEPLSTTFLNVQGASSKGASVVIDGKTALCTAPCRAEVPAGRHQVRVHLDGMNDYAAELDFAPATEKLLDLQMASAPSRTGGWTAVGIGAALLGGGIVVGVLSNKQQDAVRSDINAGLPVTSDDSRLHTGKVEAVAADIMMVAGALVGLALGLPSLLSSGPDSEARIQDRSLGVAPMPLPGGAGIGAGWRY